MMKFLFLTLFLCTSLPSMAQEKGALHVMVHNIKNDSGSIRVALFRDEESFLEKEYIFKSVPVNGNERVTVEFNELPAGQYGISVFHDENDNEELDTNFIGIPTEPFGFGNDAMGAFGPPSFRKASVSVATGITSTSVKLKSF
jgi:uncharacterized protein (DUF2141 family)